VIQVSHVFQLWKQFASKWGIAGIATALSLTFNFIQTSFALIMCNNIKMHYYWLYNVLEDINITDHLKSSVFWDVAPCSPMKVNWCLKGTYCLHLQGRRVSQSMKQAVGIARLLFSGLILWPWRWRWYVPLKCWLAFTGLLIVISQKIELFTVTTERTSYPTYWPFVILHWVFLYRLQSVHLGSWWASTWTVLALAVYTELVCAFVKLMGIDVDSSGFGCVHKISSIHLLETDQTAFWFCGGNI
jgi:hypothetical protein